MTTIDSVLAYVLRALARSLYSQEAKTLIQSVKLTSQTASEEGPQETLIAALVHAEDHRFYEHYGVDSKSIARAVIATVFTEKSQGGSTITQQLVRVVTGDYRRCLSRKFKELCLSALLDSEIEKEKQALAYLHVAYFGWRMNGVVQAASRLDIRLPCTPSEAAAIVARLKYPEPKNMGSNRKKQILVRQIHILQRMKANSEQSPRASGRI